MSRLLLWLHAFGIVAGALTTITGLLGVALRAWSPTVALGFGAAGTALAMCGRAAKIIEDAVIAVHVACAAADAPRLSDGERVDALLRAIQAGADATADHGGSVAHEDAP